MTKNCPPNTIMKHCNKCNTTKNDLEFYKNNSKSDGLQSNCIACCNERSQSHYRRSKKDYLNRNKKHRNTMRLRLRELKEVPCEDCKRTYPYYVMQFDHIKDKKITLSSNSHYTSTKKMLEEIDKCEVVCANCHAERTAKRAGYSLVGEIG